MKKRYLLAVLVILFCLNMSSVFAEPDDIYIGLYVLGVDHYDIPTGTYTMDFYLDFTCRTNCSIENFEPVNGHDFEDYTKSIGSNGIPYYRVESSFVERIDLKDFPFDTQKLKIVIEDRSRSTEKVRLIPNFKRSGLDDRIFFPGWIVTGWDAYSYDYYYPIYGTTYSTYVFEINLKRPFEDALLIFLPVVIVLLIVFFAFFLGLKSPDLRIAIVSTALFCVIMFHLALATRLPPTLGSFLFVDKFMLLTYFILFLFFVDTYVMEFCIQKKRIKLAKKIHSYTKFNLVILSIILYALLFVLFFAGII